MKVWQVALLSVLLLAASVRTEDAPEEDDYAGDSEERAHLIARKHIKEEVAVQGRNLTIFVDVYNAGVSSAKSVSIKDAALPAGLKLLSGSLTASFAKVEVGETASHSYVVLAEKGAKGYVLEPATVSYIAEIDTTDKQVGTSSKCGIYVMTSNEQVLKYALDAGTYVSLGFARTPTDWRNALIAFIVIGSLVGGNSLVKKAKTARTTQQRKRALASLEKDE